MERFNCHIEKSVATAYRPPPTAKEMFGIEMNSKIVHPTIGPTAAPKSNAVAKEAYVLDPEVAALAESKTMAMAADIKNSKIIDRRSTTPCAAMAVTRAMVEVVKQINAPFRCPIQSTKTPKKGAPKVPIMCRDAKRIPFMVATPTSAVPAEMELPN